MTQQPKGNEPNKCECPAGYDEMYHCKRCDDCCFGWGLFGNSFDSYEDRGLCISCSLDDGMTLQEAQYLIDK